MLLIFLGKATVSSEKVKKQIYLKWPFYGLRNVFVARWTFPSSLPALQAQATP